MGYLLRDSPFTRASKRTKLGPLTWCSAGRPGTHSNLAATAADIAVPVPAGMKRLQSNRLIRETPAPSPATAAPALLPPGRNGAHRDLGL
jgi:hypothetical protein